MHKHGLLTHIEYNLKVINPLRFYRALIKPILHSLKYLLILFTGIGSAFFSVQSSAQIPIQASGPLITTESNLMVPMRDGVSIALDIYRPAQSGSYPTLYSSAPYPHTDDSAPPDNSSLGSIAWFVSQGFNYVIASSRGTGLSEGNYEFLSREEQQDHYEIIEWIAEQTWSDGQVIGAGSNYFATAQWQMAIQNPPSLSCIAPVNGVVQPYQDWAFHGGLADYGFLQDWYESKVRRANAYADLDSPTLVNYDLRLELLAHPLYDDYWQLRSSLPNAEAINVPVFIVDSWQENMGLKSNLIALERLNSQHKMVILSSDTALMQNMDFLEEHLLPYYQWCLQDEFTADFTLLPELRYQNRGETLLQAIDAWPPQESTYSAMFLNRQELDPNAPATLDFEIQPNNIAISRYGTLDENSSIESLTFISNPLANDLLIAGPIMLELYVSSTETDTAFEVTLLEEINLEQITSNLGLPRFLMDVIESATGSAESTSRVQVSSGTLKASMREITTASEDNYQPQYVFTSRLPLVPSRTTRMNIAMQAIAHRFRAGSRIVLRINQAEDDSLAETSRQDSILHNQRNPSRIWLPVLSGDLETVEPEPYEDLSEISIDLQSELVTDPVSGVRFDTGFSSELDSGEITDSLRQIIDNPILFIRPAPASTLETTEEN
jgi:predicted acyl esterase